MLCPIESVDSSVAACMKFFKNFMQTGTELSTLLMEQSIVGLSTCHICIQTVIALFKQSVTKKSNILHVSAEGGVSRIFGMCFVKSKCWIPREGVSLSLRKHDEHAYVLSFLPVNFQL